MKSTLEKYIQHLIDNNVNLHLSDEEIENSDVNFSLDDVIKLRTLRDELEKKQPIK